MGEEEEEEEMLLSCRLYNGYDNGRQWRLVKTMRKILEDCSTFQLLIASHGAANTASFDT